MAENKITLGQLVNVLTESGIDLNEIYLDENQINGMQTSLSEENQKKLVGFVSNLMKSVPEEELSEIGGGTTLSKETKATIKKVGTIGASILAGVTGITTVVAAGVELLGKYGPASAKTALSGYTPSALGNKLVNRFKSSSTTIDPVTSGKEKND